MPPTFYLAIGGRSTLADLHTLLAVGQRHFLVPAGTAMAETLRCIPENVRVVLDSGAWPIANPDRLSLAQYAAEILRWRAPDGSWGRLDWFASYDHITDPAASQHDAQRLLTLLADAGAADAPLVPVTHYPSGHACGILLDLDVGYAGSRADLVDGPLARPCYGVGGLVPALSPTRPHALFDEADQWYDDLLHELEQASDTAASDVEAPSISPDLLTLHLFGIGRPSFVLRSPLVASFDTSGPIQQARFGWQKIAPSYTPLYGISAEKLQTSRLARIAYWAIRYQAAAGLHWQPFSDQSTLADDALPPAFVQYMLDMAA